MAKGDLKLTVDTKDLDKIVKVKCCAFDCKHNGCNIFMGEEIGPYCGLKRICIVDKGTCEQYEEVK